MRKNRLALTVLLFPVLAVVFLVGWVIAYFAELPSKPKSKQTKLLACKRCNLEA